MLQQSKIQHMLRAQSRVHEYMNHNKFNKKKKRFVQCIIFAFQIL